MKTTNVNDYSVSHRDCAYHMHRYLMGDVLTLDLRISYSCVSCETFVIEFSLS